MGGTLLSCLKLNGMALFGVTLGIGWVEKEVVTICKWHSLIDLLLLVSFVSSFKNELIKCFPKGSFIFHPSRPLGQLNMCMVSGSEETLKLQK